VEQARAHLGAAQEEGASPPLSVLAAISRLANFALQSYALLMAAAATLVMWFHLRSPELAEDFERLASFEIHVR
jgi:hypothetical protein